MGEGVKSSESRMRDCPAWQFKLAVLHSRRTVLGQQQRCGFNGRCCQFASFVRCLSSRTTLRSLKLNLPTKGSLGWQHGCAERASMSRHIVLDGSTSLMGSRLARWLMIMSSTVWCGIMRDVGEAGTKGPSKNSESKLPPIINKSAAQKRKNRKTTFWFE